MVETAEDVYALRQAGRVAAAAAGVQGSGQVRLATALSELGREIVSFNSSAVAEFSLGEDGWLEVRIHGVPRAALEPHDYSAVESAKRLIDCVEIADSPHGVMLSLRLPARGTSSADLRNAIAAAATPRPLDELRLENRDLIATLEELREKQDQLIQLNAELEETNRGVVAMYAQLSDELEETNRGVVALYAELDDKTLQLNTANEAKTRFLASVSHELRSPVSSIAGLVKLLLDPIDETSLSEEQRMQLRYIETSSRELLQLVNDLLDLSKAESGRLEPDVTTFDLAALLSELRGSLRPLVQPGVELIVDVSNGGLVESDRTLVGQVLRNLLVNALKFTERGSVTLTCKDISGYAVEVSIRDTGIGIALEDQPRIFEEFYQVRGPLQARSKGTGLGLPYAKRVSETLGGMLELDSEPGEGSTFTFRLPRAWRVFTSRAAAVEESLVAITLGVALIVDDDAGLRSVLRGMLQGVATQVYEAEGGIEGLEMMRTDKPEVVFLDLRMPDMDGAAVLSEMKRDPALREIPVIIVSSEELGLDDRFGTMPFVAKSTLSRDVVVKAIGKALPEKVSP